MGLKCTLVNFFPCYAGFHKVFMDKVTKKLAFLLYMTNPILVMASKLGTSTTGSRAKNQESLNS